MSIHSDLDLVREEVESQEITETVCIDLIKIGDNFKDYGLFLAKTEVHKDSQKGWNDFCKKVGISKRYANQKINFYEAKSGAMAPDSLPNTERPFRALSGETIENKAEQYTEVKNFTNKDNPTAKEIEEYIKQKEENSMNDITEAQMNKQIREKLPRYTHVKKGTKREIAQRTKELIDIFLKTSFEFKKKVFPFVGKKGMIKPLEMLSGGASEKNIVDYFKKETPTEKRTKIALAKKKEEEDVPKNLKECRETNASLKNLLTIMTEENKEKSKEIDRLNKIIKTYDPVKKLHLTILSVLLAADKAKKAKEQNNRLFNEMKPNLQKALVLLKLPTMEKPTIEEVKRNYKDLIKQHHPDKVGNDGNVDMFRDITEAYKTIKDMLKD